jgi:hypothetical protein
MNLDQPTGTWDPADQLESVLLDYLRALEVGQTPDHSALIARHPELADQLRACFADQDHLAPLLAPLKHCGNAATSPGLTVKRLGE